MGDKISNIPKRFIVKQSTSPSNPFDGQLWRDTSSNTLKQYDKSSSTWENIQTVRSDTAPANPTAGLVWIDTAGNNVETNQYDSNSSSWELIIARGSDTPEHEVNGSLWRDTGANVLKQYTGSSWEGIGGSGDGSTISSGSPFSVLESNVGLGFEEDPNSPHNFSGSASVDLQLSNNYDIIVVQVLDLESTDNNLYFTYDGSSNHDYVDVAGNTNSGASRISISTSGGGSCYFGGAIILEGNNFTGSSRFNILGAGSTFSNSGGWADAGFNQGASAPVGKIGFESHGGNVNGKVRIFGRDL